MGGVNHQPCNRQGTRYLVISTKLSRAFTSGRAKFEQANVCLEDVLLSELEIGEDDLNAFSQILMNLDLAANDLDAALSLLTEMEDEMRMKGYEPLPAFALYADLAKAELLYADLAKAGIADLSALKTIARPQLSGAGFYAALPILRDEISKTRHMISALRLLIFSTSHIAARGDIATELETNGSLNFRAAFMATYAQWNQAYALFLASAAWSSEMWYQSMGYGSMVRHIEHQRAAG